MNYAASTALQQLFGSYFHQDWTLESKTPEQAVSRFLDSCEPATASQAAGDLAELLHGVRREAVLRAALERLGCYFEPSSAGHSWRTWLESVLQQLEANRHHPGKPAAP